MRCAEIRANLPAFVLGELEPEEAVEVESHLALCPDCRDELWEFQKVNRALEVVAPVLATPPAYLKGEILSRVHAEQLSRSDREASYPFEAERRAPSRPNRLSNLRIVLPSAAAVVAITALGIFFGFLREEPPVATVQLIPTPDEASRLTGYWGVAELRPQPWGNQSVELKLNNFEEPEPNSYYELWFVSGERRISAGSFTSVGEGETRVMLNVPPEARKFHTLLITEERVDDDPAPSQEVALKGEAP